MKDGGGPTEVEGPRLPSLLSKVAKELADATPTPVRTRFDPDSATITATPESDLATHGSIRRREKTAPRAGTTSVPSDVEERLNRIGSEGFVYSSQDIALALEHGFDLKTQEGRAKLALLGKPELDEAAEEARRHPIAARLKNTVPPQTKRVFPTGKITTGGK